MIQILSGVGLFFLGIMVGAFFHRSFQGESSKNKRLEQKLAELQDTYTRYQADVSAHFMETAQKVQTLNQSYRDVHAQLAKGAGTLCNEEQADDFLAISFASEGTPREKRIIPEPENQAPPMDYAPKETPDAEGTLSEKFGMNTAEIQPELDDENTAVITEPPRN